MLVMTEAFDMWISGKNPEDYHLYFKNWWERDMASMVKRERNHPSIIMWSIGNEIKNEYITPMLNASGRAMFSRDLASFVRMLDPSDRAVTSAVNHVMDYDDSFFDALDV